MSYCYKCGNRLFYREHQSEGRIHYCERCKEYRFPVFSTACSMIVLNPDRDKILLIKQYGKNRNVLVSGYVDKGENAESAVVREVREETGLDVSEINYLTSEYFKLSETLMLCYSCTAQSEDLNGLNCDEVDSAEWFSFANARRYVMKNSLAQRFLNAFLDNQ